jgi:hypothetical protein
MGQPDMVVGLSRLVMVPLDQGIVLMRVLEELFDFV